MAIVKFGVIGLGRMGIAIARRVLAAGHTVIGYDVTIDTRTSFQKSGGVIATSLTQLVQEAQIIWIMVPAGESVDTIIVDIRSVLRAGVILIDGGNSHFSDTTRRSDELLKFGVYWLDCGTSGGVLGEKVGFSLMVGGDEEAYKKVEQFLKVIAAPNGYRYCGPSGAGHYIKMIHNGIEYSVLQAYAEGFHLLKESKEYPNLNLEKISEVWRHGAVIRSWILDLCHEIFKEDQTLQKISGAIGENKTGRWTLQEAKKQGVPMKLLEDALVIREQSRVDGGNFATKVVALLRKKFGGHEVKKL